MDFDRILRRTREVIEVNDMMADSGVVEFNGEVFDIGPYPYGLSVPEGSIPVYNAAIGRRNTALTGAFADGWLPSLIPIGQYGHR